MSCIWCNICISWGRLGNYPLSQYSISNQDNIFTVCDHDNVHINKSKCSRQCITLRTYKCKKGSSFLTSTLINFQWSQYSAL